MDRERQIAGLNRFVSNIYGIGTVLPTLLADLGFNGQQVEVLCHTHLHDLVTSFITLVKERMVTYSDGERLYQIISRRFGLDGAPPETLQTLAGRYGISRERVRQLEEKALKKCRARAARRAWEAGLRAMALAFLGEGDAQLLSLARPQAPSGDDQCQEGAGAPTGRIRAGGRDTSMVEAKPEQYRACVKEADIPEGTDPLAVDQYVRQAIAQCWMLLPGTERSAENVEKEILRLVHRAIQDLRTDIAAFGISESRRPEPPSAEERLARIRATYPKAYEPWLEEDDDALKRMYERGVSIDELSGFFQRQPSAICARLTKLGFGPNIQRR